MASDISASMARILDAVALATVEVEALASKPVAMANGLTHADVMSAFTVAEVVAAAINPAKRPDLAAHMDVIIHVLRLTGDALSSSEEEEEDDFLSPGENGHVVVVPADDKPQRAQQAAAQGKAKPVEDPREDALKTLRARHENSTENTGRKPYCAALLDYVASGGKGPMPEMDPAKAAKWQNYEATRRLALTALGR